MFPGNAPILNATAILQQVFAKYCKPYNKEKHWYDISEAYEELYRMPIMELFCENNG